MSRTTVARIAAVVYLLYFITAFTGAQLSGGVTALGGVSLAALRASTYQAGIALGEVSTVLYVALVVLLYSLLRSANGTIAVVALVFGATGCAVTAVAEVFQNAAAADAGLASAFLEINGKALHLALVFFAVFDGSVGFLIYRSGFLPRFVGVAMMVAGAGWLTAIAPSIPPPIAIPVAVVGALAEVVLMVWLFVFGFSARGRASGRSG